MAKKKVRRYASEARTNAHAWVILLEIGRVIKKTPKPPADGNGPSSIQNREMRGRSGRMKKYSAEGILHATEKREDRRAQHNRGEGGGQYE